MTQKKKIAILSCLEATKVCSGAACMKALNGKKNHFEIYQQTQVELIAFFHCNGCFCNYETDAEYIEKIETLIVMAPDAVHVGKCTLVKGEECAVITNIISQLRAHNITVIRGTH